LSLDGGEQIIVYLTCIAGNTGSDLTTTGDVSKEKLLQFLKETF